MTSPLDLVRSENQFILKFMEDFRGYAISAIEHSVKVTAKKTLSDRVLVMIEKKNIDLIDVRVIANRLNFPQTKMKSLLEEISLCDSLGFSLELDGDKFNYRIYLENYYTKWRMTKVLESGKNKTRTITSFKWDKGSQNCITTNYDLVIDYNKVTLDKEVKSSGYGTTPDFILDILRKKESLRLYSAYDTNTPRTSFYVQMENKYLKDLSEDVLSLSNDNLIETLSKFSDVPIHHFGGGIDKNKDRYFNIYFIIYNKNAIHT